uniref:WPE palindromic element domain-containing protein n=1 Tax=Wolbachia endosymbiont (group A) of Anoplius nigerrimus TaxID=2953979 RepID=UPI0022300002|nr:WPE palindromic element domain-containing protein [Wolbachia endosymbiont (group A) of Anoplius nigerrimus]
MASLKFCPQSLEIPRRYDVGLLSFQRSFLVIPVPRHWDPEKLIMYYTTFSIKSWIPVSSTGMTPFFFLDPSVSYLDDTFVFA